MNMKTYLGKIESIRIGRGGYQDVMFGVSITLEGQGFGTCDFRGTWDSSMADDKEAKWLKQQRECYADTLLWLDKLCAEAKVTSVDQLKGKPVEMTFDGPNGKLVSWRILKEVL